MTNARAVAWYLDKLKPYDITLVACGVIVKREIGLEDVIGAGAIINNLQSKTKLTDLAMLALLAYQNPRWRELVLEGMVAAHLRKLEFGEVLKYCIEENTSQTVPIFTKDRIILAGR